MNFSAVILAGGKSSRMGRDKAWLPLDGQPLLAQQIALVRELAPADIFISGRADTDYRALGCPVLKDEFADAGPLAGIAAGLKAASAPLILVLAVDLPHMSADLLERLLAACEPERGVVPRLAGQIEPLAAVYPGVSAALANAQLTTGRLAVRDFATRCEQTGLVRFRDLPPALTGRFANWNSPADLAAPPADSGLATGQGVGARSYLSPGA